MILIGAFLAGAIVTYIFMDIYRPKKVKVKNTKNPYAEFMDISAEELSELHTEDQLRSAYNNCLIDHYNRDNNQSKVLAHLRTAWMIVTIRSGLNKEAKKKEKG